MSFFFEGMYGKDGLANSHACIHLGFYPPQADDILFGIKPVTSCCAGCLWKPITPFPSTQGGDWNAGETSYNADVVERIFYHGYDLPLTEIKQYDCMMTKSVAYCTVIVKV